MTYIRKTKDAWYVKTFINHKWVYSAQARTLKAADRLLLATAHLFPGHRIKLVRRRKRKI